MKWQLPGANMCGKQYLLETMTDAVMSDLVQLKAKFSCTCLENSL